jgi:hypothetical protein
MGARRVQVSYPKIRTTIPEVSGFIGENWLPVMLVFLREDRVEVTKKQPWSIRTPSS